MESPLELDFRTRLVLRLRRRQARSRGGRRRWYYEADDATGAPQGVTDPGSVTVGDST
jgi:hypothetical protein